VGNHTTEHDVDTFLDTLPQLVDELENVETASTEALARFRPPEDATR